MRVVSVTPNPNETGVVLGRTIEVVFDKPVDPATVTAATFALMGPGQTALVDADEMIRNTPQPLTGREYITGTFAFPEPTKLVFTPGKPLRPSVVYSVTLAGGGSLVALSVIKATDGEKLASSYTFQFTTGTLDVITPPLPSPLPEETPDISVDEIRVIPRRALGADLAQEIEIHFPDIIDALSLDPSYSGGVADTNPFNDIVVSVDALVDDPTVPVPEDLKAVVQVERSVVKVRISGWQS